MRKSMIMLGAAAIAGCVNTSDRIAAELVKAGLDQTRAQCVGNS
ncbi:MAG: hypothetical protein AVDCRST_MAG51-3334, partial [uncultured Ramlibacter sp.]